MAALGALGELFDWIQLRKGCPVLHDFFGKHISWGLVAKWQRGGNEQVRYQAELIAIPLALQTWRESLLGRDLLIFSITTLHATRLCGVVCLFRFVEVGSLLPFAVR